MTFATIIYNIFWFLQHN